MNKLPTWKSPFEFDMLLQQPVHEMMAEGILVDQEEKKRLQVAAISSWAESRNVLKQVVGFDLNVSSPKQVPEFLFNTLGLPKKTKKKTDGSGESKITGDEEALRATMSTCFEQIGKLKTDSAKQRYMIGFIACKEILKIRGIRKQLSSYLGIHISKGKIDGEAALEDPDGRVRGTISVGGTETARFSHSKTLWDTGVNLATVPKSLRSMYIADEGYELAEFDLNRGESWVYAHLSEDPELLRIHTEGLDFHSETASAISGVIGEKFLSVEYIIEHKDGDCFKLRYVGKRVNHASSYRMKRYTCAESINAEAEDTGITVTVGEAGKAQEAWHRKYFMVRSNWWPEIERQIGSDRTMRTPYGRVHTFHGFLGDELYKAATAYVPQSTSVDYLNRGFLKVFHRFQKPEAWGLKILAQVHDSILVKYRVGFRDEAIQSIVETMHSSLTIKDRTFSIPVEPQYGQSWGKLKGYKIASKAA